VNLSTLSDELLVVTTLAYVVALMLHAAEYSLSSKRRTSAVAVEERALVGAGAPVVSEAPVSPPAAGKPARDWGAAAGRWALWATGLGVLSHFAMVAARGLAAHRMPWGNMYEFVLSATFVGAVAWLVMAVTMPQVRRLGVVLTLVQVLLLGFAGMVLYTQVSPLELAGLAAGVIHVAASVLDGVNPNVLSDVAVACDAARAGLTAASVNVRINVAALKDAATGAALADELDAHLLAVPIADRVSAAVLARITGSPT
jgi:hypothetical protein